MRSQIPEHYEIHAIVRNKESLNNLPVNTQSLTVHEVRDLAHASPFILAPIFEGAVSVIHLAAAISERAPVNQSITVGMARNVAAAAVAAKVGNVIVLSSIYARLAENKANNARDYGYRKLAADRCFMIDELAHSNIAVLRSPAVYGDGMGGNLELLTQLIGKRIPLPFGLANAPRDYISIGNLVDLIWHIIKYQITENPSPGIRIYEPSDGHPITTKMLVQTIAAATGQPAVLLPVPLGLLMAGAKLTGKSELAEGAVGRLEAAGNAALETDFGWVPIEQMPGSLSHLRSRR